MTYAFANHNRPDACTILVARQSGFDAAAIAAIREAGDALQSTTVKVYDGDSGDVQAAGAGFPLTDESKWVYDATGKLVQEINSQTYQYDLTGFAENLYYLRYDGASKDFFNWHFDMGRQNPAPRKLTMILQLSDPSEYEGGELELMGSHGTDSVHKEQGLIAIFPSYKLHRVTPVTAGVRRVLVGFVSGPNFR